MDSTCLRSRPERRGADADRVAGDVIVLLSDSAVCLRVNLGVELGQVSSRKLLLHIVGRSTQQRQPVDFERRGSEWVTN